MTFDVRPVKEEEFMAFGTAGATGFGGTEFEHPEDERKILDLPRTLATFDGEEIVSTAASFEFDLTVPGAQVPVAGVTWVSVKPTHRRRGVLRNVMEKQLKDVHELGESLAVLWASESLIYGRFGYGLGALGKEIKIERPWSEIEHGIVSPGNCRLVSRDQALAAWPPVYDEVLPTQPGMYTRSDNWWAHKVLQEEKAKPDKKPARFYVQYEEDGRPRGFAIYTIDSKWHANFPDGRLEVEQFTAATRSAYAGLWRYILGVDLISKFEVPLGRIDEPLFWMMKEPRRLIGRVYDALWVRIVDVAPALEARRYSAEGELVFEVRDEFCPWNAGTYKLEAGSDGATCKRSGAKPDLVLRAADLGAAYLGGTRFRDLYQAGRVEGDVEAVDRADDIFRWHVLPWCPEVF